MSSRKLEGIVIFYPLYNLLKCFDMKTQHYAHNLSCFRICIYIDIIYIFCVGCKNVIRSYFIIYRIKIKLPNYVKVPLVTLHNVFRWLGSCYFQITSKIYYNITAMFPMKRHDIYLSTFLSNLLCFCFRNP